MADDKRYSFDRCEGDLAVLVDDEGNQINVPLCDLPQGSREGSVLRLFEDRYAIDKADTDRRRSHVLTLQNRLRRKR